MSVEEKAQEFLVNRTKINNIADILNKIQEERVCDGKTLSVLESVFKTILENKDMIEDPNLSTMNKKAYDAELAYINFCKILYQQFFKICCEFFNDEEIGQQSFQSATTLLETEGKNPFENGQVFPVARLTEIIMALISCDRKSHRIGDFGKLVQYADILFNSWKILKKELSNVEKITETFLFNLLEFLDRNTCLKMVKSLFSLEEVQLNFEMVQRWISQIWLNLVRIKLSKALHRKLLLVFLEKYLNTIRKPVLFADFFMCSLSDDLANSLLSLQGMSILVQKHNLECPNIFGRLYWMLQPEIFDSKYKPRLFYLTDLFLSSSHISEQLVAAYVKRLSRLALTAPAPDILILLRLISNLLIRHPSLKILINQPDEIQVDGDPFLFEEEDPLKSRAMESSLWEIQLLKRHALPKVASAAHFIDQNLPAMEADLAALLDYTYNKMFDQEIKKNPKKDVATNFIRPTNLKLLKDDRLFKLWSLQ